VVSRDCWNFAKGVPPLRSVMVTKFLPLPADSGGKRRSLAVLERLARLGSVVLCAFDQGEADLESLAAMGVEVRSVPWAPTLSRITRGIAHTGSGSAARFWDRRLAGMVAAAGKSPIDVLQVEYATLAPYLKETAARLRVLDLHNIESSLAASYASSTGRLRALPARAEVLALRRLERVGLRRADIAVVVSRQDRDRLPRSDAGVLLCPNGWEPGPLLPPAPDPVVIFVALFGWRPNVDAAVWLAERVWPLVRRQRPDARLLLVGRSPTLQVQRLACSDITVTGSVPDVRPFLAQAQVAVAPLLSGGGTRLKVLEALDAGRPVVATRIGAEGLEDLIGQGVVVADTAEQMSAAICDLLEDDDQAQKLGAQGRRAVAERYAWDVTLEPLLRRLQT
jgi:polysaccharide biosynthesis protein PslH